VLLASCFLLRASFFLPRASCFLLLASCFLLLASCFLLLASCFLLLASCRDVTLSSAFGKGLSETIVLVFSCRVRRVSVRAHGLRFKDAQPPAAIPFATPSRPHALWIPPRANVQILGEKLASFPGREALNAVNTFLI